jgi:phospholipid/cholesterol/gamma-HCH transport system ATP-binding protein
MAEVADDQYVIEIEGLVNTVGANTILHRDLNLKVRRDEVMSLVGGSGSGKTQLIRVILGLKRPAAGKVRERGGLSEEDIRGIVHAKLAQVELNPGHGKLLPANLSGGMVKRVSLARALALSPDLLILDEPTAGLDPDRSEGFVRLIKRLREDHRFAVVMVTHDLDTLFELTDRVAVLADQRIIACDTLEVVRQMDHKFVQNFFGGDRGRRALQHG